MCENVVLEKLLSPKNKTHIVHYFDNMVFIYLLKKLKMSSTKSNPIV